MSPAYISLLGVVPPQNTFIWRLQAVRKSRGTVELAEMTPGSNHALVISRKGIERSQHYTHLKHRSDKVSHFSQSKLKDQKAAKSPCIRSRLKFCLKDQARMEQRESDSTAEGTEKRLKELTTKWFIDTQVPLIVNNGLLPTWFLGFIIRKDAEELLREKELGCFLIRLSKKAIGYILSYKGRDRCRHFVINQIETGQFVVFGDTEGHNTLPELIEYYKIKPIQPFGENLTSSCFEAPNDNLYDFIQDKPVAVARALKNIQESSLSPEQTRARPAKSSRTAEEVPPLPRRSRLLDSSLVSDHVLYAQLRKHSPRGTPGAQHASQETLAGAKPGRSERPDTREERTGRCRPLSEPESVYSELDLLDIRNRSVSPMDSRLSAPPNTPPRLSPKPARLPQSSSPQSRRTEYSGSRHNLDCRSDNTLYHLAGSPKTTSFDTRSSTPEQDGDSVYAEVLDETPSSFLAADSMYEMIPASKETPKPKNNPFQSVEDLRSKHSHSSWGLKNNKWKWLFPEAKRKW